MKRKLSLILAALVCGASFVGGAKAASVDDVYNNLVKNGVFEVPSIAPANEEEKQTFFDIVVNSYVISKLGNSYTGYLSNCNENYECDFTSDYYIDGYSSQGSRTDRVQVVWKDTDSNIKATVDSYMEKIVSIMEKDEIDSIKRKTFVLNDLTLINGLYHYKNGSFGSAEGIHYVSELKGIIDNSKITYTLDPRLGDASPFYGMGGGGFTLFYDGVAYASLVDGYIGVANNYVLYIPEGTEDNPDAYIAAAKARIDAYLGKNDIKIELAGNLDDIDGIEQSYISIDKAKTGNYYYKITINNNTYDYLIMKNSDVSVPVVETKDFDTNVSVKTTSSEIPLDTEVIVNEVKKDAAEFKEFVEKVKKDVIKAFDISLYSKTVGNVTRLEKGVFEVRLPLGLEYVGRKLSAYYVKEDGSLEEHPITLDESGNAIFETTHFSTYFIADASNTVTEEVPKTFDKVDLYIILAVSGLIGLFSCVFFFRTN